ncbi:MAG: translocation/assembly module TamB domain-containing protein [Candidatus Wallbacteria bacterium]
MNKPGKMLKLFLGTIGFVFFTLVISVYLFSNTFLKYYLMNEMKHLFPGNFKFSFLASDLLSHISFKSVLLQNPQLNSPTAKNASVNTDEIKIASFELNGSVLDAVSGNPNFNLNFAGLDLTIKSDGQKVYFPECLGPEFLNFNEKNMQNPLKIFKYISFEDCKINMIVYSDNTFKHVAHNIVFEKFTGKLQPTDAKFEHFTVKSSFNYSDKFITLENINYNGDFDFNKMAMAGKLSINDGRVNNLNKLTGNVIKFNGNYSCNYDFTVQLNKLNQPLANFLNGNAEFKVSSSEVAITAPIIGDIKFTGLSGLAILDSSTLKLNFKDFKGTFINSPVTATGEIDITTNNINLHLNGSELKMPGHLENFADANFSGDFSIIGPLNAPDFKMQANSKLVFFKNIAGSTLEVENINADLTITPSTIELKNSSFKCLDTVISLAARVNLKSFLTNGDILIKSAGSKFFNFIEKSFNFKLPKMPSEIKSAEFAFEGTYPNFIGFDVTGTAEVSNYKLLGDDVTLNTVNFKMKNGEIKAPNVRLITKGVERRNEVTGTYNILKNEYTLDGKNLVFNSASLAEIKGMNEIASKFSGLLAASFNIKGSGNSQTIDFFSNLEQVKINKKNYGINAIKGELLCKSGNLEVKTLKINDNIKLNHGEIDNNQNFKLNFDLYEVDLSQLKNFIDSNALSKAAGQINGKLNLAGNLKDLTKTTAFAELTNVEIKYQGLNLKNLSTVKIKNNNSRVDIENFHLGINNHSLNIKGFLDFKESGEVSLNVKLDDTDLKVLKLYSGNLIKDVTGNIDAELLIKGELLNPKFDGYANITAKTIKFNDFSEEITGVDFQAELKNYDVKIKSGKLKLGKADWILSGNSIINYKDSPLYLDLILESKDFKYEIAKKAIVEGNARIGIKGDCLKPRVYGSCRLEKGKIELTSDMLKTKVEPITVGNIELDVIIFADKNIWLSNNFINTELNGKITLKTAKNKLVYNGDVSTIRGTANFNRREFKITEGKILFNSNPLFDPLFKVKADTKIDIFKINLDVSGSTANPDFKLSSQPALTQPEITALLTTGQTQNTINSNDATKLPAKMYADYQKEQLLGGVKNKVKDALSLDELSVKTDGTTEKGGKIENSVSVGKYVNDKLFVTYTQNKEKDVDKKVKHYQFNYKVAPNVDLDLKESNTEGSSMGVKVKKSF